MKRISFIIAITLISFAAYSMPPTANNDGNIDMIAVESYSHPPGINVENSNLENLYYSFNEIVATDGLGVDIGATLFNYAYSENLNGINIASGSAAFYNLALGEIITVSGAEVEYAVYLINTATGLKLSENNSVVNTISVEYYTNIRPHLEAFPVGACGVIYIYDFNTFEDFSALYHNSPGFQKIEAWPVGSDARIQALDNLI